MGTVISRLTVTFDDLFWIGIYERESGGYYEVCRIVFGAEPKDYEVYGFMLENWSSLSFSPAIEANARVKKRINPKRMQRNIRKYVEDKGLGTKAQRALKLWHEQEKAGRKTYAKKLREEEKERKFELHRKKKKEKHRGS